MKKRNYKTIFYDDGKRWKKVKKLFFMFILFFTSTFAIIFYSFAYSPFESKFDKETTREINQVIEDINNNKRPIVNQGTLVTIEDLFGTKYVKRIGEDEKYVILSFDDGPDPEYTPKILEIMEKEGVKGSFFALGNMMYKHPGVGQQILDQGSDVGLHTFTHHREAKDDGPINKLRFVYEMDLSEKIFAYNYGFKTNLFRVPYMGVEENPSYYALQYIREAYLRGLNISAPTVDSSDWENQNVNEIVGLSTNPEVMGSVVLLHDSGGNRDATIKALPQIIKFYKEKGYKFITVSDLAGKYGFSTKKELTTKDKILIPVAYNAYDIYKKTPGFVKKLFVTGLFLILIHISIFVLLALSHVYKEKKLKIKAKKYYKSIRDGALISIIIPMYNEEASIRASIKSVVKSTYKNIEIIVVDDGSTDSSYLKVLGIKDNRIRILQKPNGGKFSALNYGFRFARGEITVCLDADTRVKPNAIFEIYLEFSDKKVAAVAGNIKVGNRINLLTRIQSLEYILAHSIEKRSLDLFSSVMVVPGAFGAWRTNKVKNFGGFSPRTLAEDFDLTLKLMRRKQKIAYSDTAIAYTEAPTTFKHLYYQRRRWTFGNLQVLFRHRGMLLNRKYGVLGMFFMPRTVLLQIPSIILTPLVDLFVVLNLLFGDRLLTIWFMLFYFFIQILLVLMAYKLANEKKRDILLIPLLRVPYAQFIYIVFFESIFKVFRGEKSVWKKIQHTGRFSVSQNNNLVNYKYLGFISKLL